MKLSGRHFHVAIFLFSCFNMHGLAASVGSGNDTDHQALLEFKAQITGDPFDVMPRWNNSVHFCQWYGVTCSRQRQRVTKLELRSLNLMGAVSPFIGNLSFLRVLNLENNSFSHAIPQEIGRLHRLRELRLNNNTFSGKLPPHISNCSNLEFFSVRINQLQGEIPSVLGRLSHLRTLYLSRNEFVGSVPSSFGNLSALQQLSLALNTLSGQIPESIGQLRNLTFFSLFENYGISGIIPVSIFNLSNIRLLDIGRNKLQGNLPSNIGFTMPFLEELSVDSNHITGSFPASLSNASNLATLQIQGNNITGSLPSFEKLDRLFWFHLYKNKLGSGGEIDDLSFFCSLVNATSLQFLSIGDNNFGGLLSECISNFSSVSYLFISNNNIFGRIPSGIENLRNMEILDISGNSLSGSIPFGVGRLQKLREFYAYHNHLSGGIPTSLGNLTMLLELYLQQNNLQGNIPLELGKCENLLALSLSANNLTGSIPPQVFGISSLSIFLDLSSNQLTGNLPGEIGNLKNLGALDLSSNMLLGVLPESLGSCISLEILYLRGNFFHGQIPSALISLTGLLELDLSRNNLSGEIPEFLVSFNLRYLNLSFNDLEGALPIEGVFKNASATFVQGNSKLCGGDPMFNLPRCTSKFTSNKSSKNSLKLKLAIVFAVFGLVLVFSFLLIFWFRKRNKKLQPQELANDVENSRLMLSYQSILKATDGFSSKNLVGSGSFGSVFKGILEEGGAVIAVKVFNLLSRGASKSFMAECEALRNIRHRNLVKILTAISSVDYQGNDFKALVYEFMQKGSLENWLHPSVCNEIQQGTIKHLSLIQRVNIAADVASALEYLHHRCETPIVHCDLKPSNILLDDEMIAHIGDFGLAKFLAVETPNHSITQSSTLGLRGTIGYAPPEYGLGSEVSTKGDVYSFGILLLEMFTGKRPTDEQFREGLSLHNFVKAGLAERLDEIIDPTLVAQERQYFQYLNSIFEIGLICSAQSPTERLDMIVVAAKLCSIRDKLIRPTRVHP